MKTSQLEERLGTEKTFDEELILKNKAPDFCSAIAGHLEKKGISRSELIRRIDVERTYGYQLLNGTRRPTRNHVIQMGLVLGLDIESFQKLLKTAHKKPLYVRDLFDARVFFAVKHKMDFEAASEFIWRTDSR